MNEVIMIFTSMEQKKRVCSNYVEFEIDVPQI